MRLIDAEQFRDDLYRQFEMIKVDDFQVLAVVDVDDVLDNTTEIEAIPIEWFKKQIDWHSETLTYGAEVYQWVLNRWCEDKEKWEKENENR